MFNNKLYDKYLGYKIEIKYLSPYMTRKERKMYLDLHNWYTDALALGALMEWVKKNEITKEKN